MIHCNLHRTRLIYTQSTAPEAAEATESTEATKSIESIGATESTESTGATEAKTDVKEPAKEDKKTFDGPRRYENGVLKTSARVDEVDHKKNVKFDPTLAPKVTEAEKIPIAIRKQVDYYFGDANLPKDNFLWTQTGGAENKPVPISVIMTFGRMKIFDVKDVAPALKESNFLNVTGEEGSESVSRKIAYDPTNPRIGQIARSVYIKGFGDEVPTSQFDIEAFFTTYGPTNQVKLRRTEEGLFKGSVFVEFETEELAKAFLALDPKPKWQGENMLLVQPKEEYMAEKQKLIDSGVIAPSDSRGRGRGRGGRGGFNDRGGRGRGRGRGGFKDRGGRGGGGGRGTYIPDLDFQCLTSRDTFPPRLEFTNEPVDRDPNDWKKRREDDRATGFRGNRGGRGRGQKRQRDGDGDATEAAPEAKKAKAEE